MNASILVCSALALAFSAGDKPVSSPADDTTGSISGQVLFDGERPDPKPDLKMTSDQTKGCHAHGEMDEKDNSLLINDKGGVANVVFTLTVAGAKAKVPSEPFVLDQKGCRFEPHVVVLPVGATLRYDNSDETSHNVHTLPKKNQAVNKNVPGGTNFSQELDKEETFSLKCDIHPWMKGYIVVTEATHHAVSDASGKFQINGLPAGDYTLEWWHEELGKGKTEKVTVTAGGTAKLTHKVSEKKKKKGGRRRR